MSSPTSTIPANTQADRGELLARSIATLVFLLSTALTLYFLRDMQGGMRMPGNWTMSMMWMVMPGQTLATSAVLFLLMWQAMMIAMMLPSTWPMLALYRRVAISTAEPHPGLAAFLLACGYFAAWLAFGAVSFALGFAWSSAAMRFGDVSRATPILGGIALIASGAFQFSPWKDRCLSHCRSPLMILGESWRRGLAAAWTLGWKHGLYCVGCCWALMVIQMILGVMNLAVMAAIALIIALEKLWIRGPVLARGAGLAAIFLGLAAIALELRA